MMLDLLCNGIIITIGGGVIVSMVMVQKTKIELGMEYKEHAGSVRWDGCLGGPFCIWFLMLYEVIVETIIVY